MKRKLLMRARHVSLYVHLQEISAEAIRQLLRTPYVVRSRIKGIVLLTLAKSSFGSAHEAVAKPLRMVKDINKGLMDY